MAVKSKDEMRDELKEEIRCSLFDEQDTDEIMEAIDRYASQFTQEEGKEAVDWDEFIADFNKAYQSDLSLIDSFAELKSKYQLFKKA